MVSVGAQTDSQDIAVTVADVDEATGPTITDVADGGAFNGTEGVDIFVYDSAAALSTARSIGSAPSVSITNFNVDEDIFSPDMPDKQRFRDPLIGDILSSSKS